MVKLLLLYKMYYVKMIGLSPRWGSSKTIKTNAFVFRKLQKECLFLLFRRIFIKVKNTSCKFSRSREDIVLLSISSTNTRCTYQKTRVCPHLSLMLIWKRQLKGPQIQTVIGMTVSFFGWKSFLSRRENCLNQRQNCLRWRDSPDLENVFDIVNNS